MAKQRLSPTLLTAARLEEAAALLRAVAPIFDPTPTAALLSPPPASGPPATAALAPADSKKKLSRKETRAEIVAEIRRHPNRGNAEIAEAHAVTAGYVQKIRKQLTDEAASCNHGG